MFCSKNRTRFFEHEHLFNNCSFTSLQKKRKACDDEEVLESVAPLRKRARNESTEPPVIIDAEVREHKKRKAFDEESSVFESVAPLTKRTRSESAEPPVLKVYRNMLLRKFLQHQSNPTLQSSMLLLLRNSPQLQLRMFRH